MYRSKQKYEFMLYNNTMKFERVLVIIRVFTKYRFIVHFFPILLFFYTVQLFSVNMLDLRCNYETNIYSDH